MKGCNKKASSCDRCALDPRYSGSLPPCRLRTETSGMNSLYSCCAFMTRIYSLIEAPNRLVIVDWVSVMIRFVFWIPAETPAEEKASLKTIRHCGESSEF